MLLCNNFSLLIVDVIIIAFYVVVVFVGNKLTWHENSPTHRRPDMAMTLLMTMPTEWSVD